MDFGKFWKNTNKLNPRLSLPVNIAGEHEAAIIANRFINHFKVSIDRVVQVVDAGETDTELTVDFLSRMWLLSPKIWLEVSLV